MTIAARLILILTLTLALANAVFAQEETTTTATTTTTTTTAAETAAPDKPETTSDEPRETLPSSQEVRGEFTRLLERHPSEVASVLRLDPSLLTNEGYLSAYPRLARYLSDHPEIVRNPRYYLAHFQTDVPQQPRSALGDVLEGLMILFTVTLIAIALAWFIRTIIEQRRWNRLSRTQAEVHNKILDRFGSTDELLQYIRTPAGAKFLESAPIPLHTEHQRASTPSTPLARVLLSIQIGVVVAVGALGMLLVSLRFEGESALSLFALGMIAFCVGAGFIGSAVVSLMLSKRFGLWQPPDPSAPSAGTEDAGLVR